MQQCIFEGFLGSEGGVGRRKHKNRIPRKLLNDVSGWGGGKVAQKS
jgi:hypothetical protein